MRINFPTFSSIREDRKVLAEGESVLVTAETYNLPERSIKFYKKTHEESDPEVEIASIDVKHDTVHNYYIFINNVDHNFASFTTSVSKASEIFNYLEGFLSNADYDVDDFDNFYSTIYKTFTDAGY